MADERLEEHTRQARLREQEEERRRREVTADLRLHQERQTQDDAGMLEARPADEQLHYAQLPRHSYTGIR